MAFRDGSITPPKPVARAVRASIRAHGTVATAQSIGIGREAAVRIAAGMPAKGRTILWAITWAENNQKCVRPAPDQGASLVPTERDVSSELQDST